MSEKTPPGLFASLRHLLGDLLDVGRTRLALLANEVEEEKIRLTGVLVNSILALACLIVGSVLLVAFMTLLFWESRLLVVGMSLALFIVAAVFFARQSLAGLSSGTGLFKASLAELEADVRALRAGGGTENESPPA